MSKRHWRPYLFLISAVSLIVPRRFRGEWRREWEAELRHREALLLRWQRFDLRGRLDLLRRSSGSLRDALWLQPRRMEEEMFQDIRFGARMLMRKPGFTLVAVMTLALGIGANTAIFSVVNSVLLRPLPYPAPERLVVIQEYNARGPAQVTPANFLDWREQNNVFEHLAAISTRRANLTSEGGDPQRVYLAVTSTNFFDALGVRPLHGRTFLPSEEQEGHESVAVIGHGLWQRRFGSDPRLVGRQVSIDGTNHTVIGVMPAGVQYPTDTDLWVSPRRIVPEADIDLGDITRIRGFGILAVVARLREGVTLEQAQAEMDVITARLREQYPETNNNRFDRVIALHESVVGDVRPVLLILFGAVGCVLLIACANVANLLLARSSSRRKEIAIRTALGASRWRITRQLLTESVLLALLGGAAGLLIALFCLDLLTGLAASYVPRMEEVGLDRLVLVFTLVVSILTGIIFGLVPALQTSKVGLNESLKEGSRGTSARGRLRGALVVAEVALSLMLLISAGLLFRSFIILQAVKPGFDPRNVLTLKVAPTGENYRDARSQRAFYAEVIGRVRELAGVQSVGAINTLPLSKGAVNGYNVEGRPLLPPDKMSGANRRNISPDYFHAMDIPLLKGREFTERDDADAPGAIIINESLARREFPDEDPLGKRLAFGSRNGQPVWLEIVGVVNDVRSLELNAEPVPEAYTSYLQHQVAEMTLVIRSGGDPAGIASAVQSVVGEVDKNQPVSSVRTLEQVISEATTRPRFNTLLLAVFSGVALLLAAAGIYGVMAYVVAQRTHEIGVRMALGARPRDVFKLIMSRGALLTLAGLGLGLLGAFTTTRVLSGLLYGISPTDPLTFGSVVALLAGVALLASYIPARRATKVDPMVALRYE